MGRNPNPRKMITTQEVMAAGYMPKGQNQDLDSYVFSIMLRNEREHSTREIIEYCNNKIASIPDDSDRVAWCSFVENILHYTHSYAGFGYNGWGAYLDIVGIENYSWHEAKDKG